MSATNLAGSEPEPLVEREAVVVLPRRAPQPATPEPAPVAYTPAPGPAHVAPQPPPAPPVAVAPTRADHAFVGVLGALASLLAARFLLLLSIGGAFVLAVMATRDASYVGLAILIAFCLLTVLPMTYLDVATTRRGGK
jgi:hypothetical protein